jgi:hypothetical protein
MDIDAVGIKRRHRAHHRAQHCHRMRIPPEAIPEPADLFMQHGVHGHMMGEFGKLGFFRQLAMHQKVRYFEKGGLFRQLLDRIATIQ